MVKQEKRLLRGLTARRVDEPDAAAWLVAADLLEEQGCARESLTWRRRGEWFDRLLVEVLRVAEGLRERSVLCGPYVVSLTRKRVTVLFEVLHQPEGKATAWVRRGATKGNLWRLKAGGDEDGKRRLWRQRVLALIDELSALEWVDRRVSIREAQAAAERLGPARTEEIVGAGGLSGASAEQLRRLVDEAENLED